MQKDEPLISFCKEASDQTMQSKFDLLWFGMLREVLWMASPCTDSSVRLYSSYVIDSRTYQRDVIHCIRRRRRSKQRTTLHSPIYFPLPFPPKTSSLIPFTTLPNLSLNPSSPTSTLTFSTPPNLLTFVLVSTTSCINHLASL